MDDSIEAKTCATSGNVSYFQKSTCAKSGKVSMNEVKYCTTSQKFVNASPVEGAKKSCAKSCAAKKAAAAKAEGFEEGAKVKLIKN